VHKKVTEAAETGIQMRTYRNLRGRWSRLEYQVEEWERKID
jgi:hypothetical protein